MLQTGNWTCAKEQRIPLLLFVQRVRELLLHTSSVISKPRFSSAFTITRELQFLVTQHKRLPHSSTQIQINLLIDELRNTLRTDEVAREFIGNRFSFCERLFSDTANINEQIEAGSLLRARIARYSYIEQCAERIAEIISSGGKEKGRLINLTDCATSAILDAGYPAQTVYHLLNITFFDRDKIQKVSGPEILTKFFSYFDLNLHKYVAYFGLLEISPLTEKCLPSETYQVAREGTPEYMEILGSWPQTNRQFFLYKKEVKAIICCRDVLALDPQSARNDVEKQLRFLSDVLKLKSHRHKLALTNEVIVCWDKKGQFINSTRPRPPVLRVPNDAVVSEEDVGRVMARINDLDRDSLVRFVRAVQLHSTALAGDETESQLLNIWIAFETLFVRRGTKSKIEEVIDSATPYIVYAWLHYEIGELWEAIQKDHTQHWKETVGQCPEAEQFQGIAALLAMLAIKDFEKPMTDFLSRLDTDPLLRHKLWTKIGSAQKADTILDNIEQIAQKIRLDFNRIYRARNQLVHVGRTASDLGDVVQRAHHYMDIILALIEHMVGQINGIGTIEQASLETTIAISALRDKLVEAAKTNVACTKDNFLSLHLGAGVIL